MSEISNETGMNATGCLPPSRLWKTVLQMDRWSADECVHLADCPHCQERLERLLTRVRGGATAVSTTTAPALIPATVSPDAAPGVDYKSLDPAVRSNVDYAVVTAVLDLNRPEDIAGKILQEYHAHVTPRQIREIVQTTRKNGKLVYTDEADQVLGKQLKEAFGLQTVKIVRCTDIEPVIRRGAEMLQTVIEEVRESRRTVGTPPKVRVGIAGGPVTFDVMSTCGHRLEKYGFAGEVVVDAMLPGASCLHMAFDRPRWPRLSFKDSWTKTPHLKETSFGGQFIPPMVRRKRFQELMDNDKAIAAIVRSAKYLDVIVTSGARWDDPHAAAPLKRNYPDRETWQEKHGIVGELLWHPLSRHSPVCMRYVPMTSLGLGGLKRLPALIRQGTRVMAILGPCHACGMLKTPLVASLLLQHNPIITDLVVDANTAQEVVADPLVAERLAPESGTGDRVVG